MGNKYCAVWTYIEIVWNFILWIQNKKKTRIRNWNLLNLLFEIRILIEIWIYWTLFTYLLSVSVFITTLQVEINIKTIWRSKSYSTKIVWIVGIQSFQCHGMIYCEWIKKHPKCDKRDTTYELNMIMNDNNNTLVD